VLSPTWATQVSINIPSQPLAQALNAWAQQTRLELIVQPALVTGKTAPALSGNMTPRQALDRLLAGSGLVATMDGSTAMIRTTAAGTQQLPEMRVSADALKQGTAEEGYLVSNVSGVGLWDERSLRDTPYSISVVPSDLIENVNAQNMWQIFKMNPLIQEPYIQNNNGTPVATIRGFTSFNPVYDGIPMSAGNGFAVSVIEIDRVEILSGTSGFLYGGNRVGGAVNYVTKNSTDVPLRRLTFGNYGGTQFYGHADIGGKFDDRGRFGYRANLLYQGGDTAIGEPVNQKVANIVLDGHITDTLYADIKYTYNDYRKEATSPEFSPSDRTSIDTSKRYSPKWASNDVESHKAYTSLRWDPSKYFTLRSAFFYQHTNVRATQIGLRELMDRTFIPTIVINPGHKYENYGGYIYLDTRFSTFAVDHKLTLGYSSTFNELFRRPRANLRNINSFLLDKIKHLPEPDLEIYGREPRESVWQEQYDNILIGDNITFNDQWSAMAGLNYATTISRASPSNKYEKSALTPTVSLLYKPIEDVTTYVSYMEALERGTIVGNTSLPLS